MTLRDLKLKYRTLSHATPTSNCFAPNRPGFIARELLKVHTKYSRAKQITDKCQIIGLSIFYRFPTIIISPPLFLCRHLIMIKALSVIYLSFDMSYQVIDIHWFSDEASDIICGSGGREHISHSLIIYLKRSDKTNLNFIVYSPDFFV
jgi:hypothetical protein